MHRGLPDVLGTEYATTPAHLKKKKTVILSSKRTEVESMASMLLFENGTVSRDGCTPLVCSTPGGQPFTHRAEGDTPRSQPKIAASARANMDLVVTDYTEPNSAAQINSKSSADSELERLRHELRLAHIRIAEVEAELRSNKRPGI